MSHITRVKTSLNDEEVLKAALQESGYQVEEGGMIFADYNRTRGVPVDILAHRKGERVGFRREGSAESAYEIVADWPVQARSRKKITGKIFQAYSREKVVKLAHRKGYAIVQNRLNQRGQIEIVLRKVA